VRRFWVIPGAAWVLHLYCQNGEGTESAAREMADFGDYVARRNALVASAC